MTNLKTVDDLIEQEGFIPEEHIIIGAKALKENAINWIKSLRKKSEEHWNNLDKIGFMGQGYPEGETAYSFKFEGMEFQDWHEATDVTGAIKILKHVFNISEEEKEEINDTI